MARRARADIPEPDPQLVAELRAVAKRLSTLHSDEQRRLDLVRDALQAGWTHARISEVSGLSRGRIGQIASRR